MKSMGGQRPTHRERIEEAIRQYRIGQRFDIAELQNKIVIKAGRGNRIFTNQEAASFIQHSGIAKRIGQGIYERVR